jgi:hypothetical protein
LVELVPYNLLQQSEVFSNAIWTKQQSSISTNVITAPNGTLTADKLIDTATLAQHRIDQTSTISAGNYTFSVFLKKAEIDTAYIRIGLEGANFNLTSGTTFNPNGVTSSIVDFGNGWYRCIITKTNSAANEVIRINLKDINNISYSGNGVDGIYLWGAQLVEGTSALDYQATETRLNIPRLDYSLGSCPNILLEPQRTNLALRSEEFDNAAWQNIIGGTGVNSTRVANSVISPSGIQNADTITLNRGSGNTISDFSFIFQSVTLVSSLYTLSFWIKANSPSEIGKTLMARVVGANISNQLITLTNSWQRFTFTSTAAATAGVTGIDFYNRGTLTTGNSVTFDIWGAQLEAGAYATSYIPTTSASVTRNADVISRSNIFTNGLITASGGTWFVDLRNNRALIRDSASAGLILGTNATSVGANGFAFTFGATPTAGRCIFRKYVSSIETILFTTTTDIVKIAVKWNGTTADVFQNGVKVVSATAFTATNMEYIYSTAASTPQFINSMALFPTALTDTQCIAITS